MSGCGSSERDCQRCGLGDSGGVGMMIAKRCYARIIDVDCWIRFDCLNNVE